MEQGLAGWVSAWEAVVLSPLRCLGCVHRTWRAARAGDGAALEGAELWGLSQSFGCSGAARGQAGCSRAAENANAGGLGEILRTESSQGWWVHQMLLDCKQCRS